MLHELKGEGRVLLTCLTPRGEFQLCSHPDESWSIRMNGHVVGGWEHDQQDECFTVLGGMIGLGKRADRSLLAGVVPPNSLDDESRQEHFFN